MADLSCDGLAAKLSEANLPILLLDTCAILDVVRTPVRNQLCTHDIDAIHTLIFQAMRKPPEVSFVISQQVVLEFQEHIDRVETETRDLLRKAGEEFAAILERIQALSPCSSIPAPVDLLSLGFPNQGRNLAEQIVRASSVLTDDPNAVLRAWNRVRLAKPPATRSKQSIKDCVITENCLSLASSLRTFGFSRNMVFTTSNLRDYEQSHTSLHPELRLDFDSVSLEYAPNWSAARHEIDK